MFVHFNFVEVSTLRNFLTPKFSRSTVSIHIKQVIKRCYTFVIDASSSMFNISSAPVGRMHPTIMTMSKQFSVNHCMDEMCTILIIQKCYMYTMNTLLLFL